MQGVAEAAGYAVFSGGCRTVRQPRVDEASSGEGDAYCTEFCLLLICCVTEF